MANKVGVLGPLLVLVLAQCTGAVGDGGAMGLAPPGGNAAGGPGTGSGRANGNTGGATGRDPDGRRDAGGGQTAGGAGGPSEPMADAGAPAPTADAASPDLGPGAAPGGNTAAGPWARDIALAQVELSQGVAVKLSDDDEVLPVAERNAPIVEGRPIFLRAYVDAAQGFQERSLRAVLTLVENGQPVLELENAKEISEDSDHGELGSTFNFEIPPEAVKPDRSLWIGLYEASGAPASGPAMGARFPAEGAVEMGAKAGRMELDVVAVPVHGPGGPLEDTPELRKNLENHLFDLYPVQKVNLRIHAPVERDEDFTSSSDAFAILREIRRADNAKPHEYYHLLVAREDSNFRFAGVASRAGDRLSDASRRVAITVVRRRAVDGNVDTTAHEIGHNNGLRHSPGCGAAGPDTNYPNQNGDLVVDGYSLSKKALRSYEQYNDLLSYCRPRWASDYIWRAIEERVRTINGFAAMPEPEMVSALASRSLQTFVGPGETPVWGLVPGDLVGPEVQVTPTTYARLKLDGGGERVIPVEVRELSDGGVREIALNLPDEGPEVLEAVVVVDGQSHPVNVLGL